MHLKDVPKDAAERMAGRPFVAFSLLQHEHKKSVVHFTIQRNTEYEETVRSKVSKMLFLLLSSVPVVVTHSQDPLILCVGPRRLRVRPVYSQYGQGGSRGVNNVHKFTRYLRHSETYVATVYAPILFGYQPCALLREAAADANGGFLRLAFGRVPCLSLTECHLSSVARRDGHATQP